MSEPATYTLPELVAGQRAIAVPFLLPCRLRFTPVSSGEVDARLLCEAILRHLPGRRLVVRASYQGSRYAVKLFFGPQAQRYARRETHGLSELQRSGVTVAELTAELTLTGEAVEPGYGVMTAWVPDTQAVREDDHAAVLQVVAAVGQMHAHGVLRTDPHLRNYLRLGDGTVCAVDGDGVRSRASVGRGRGLTNLARTLAELPPAADARLAEACQAYSRARWQTDAGAELLAAVRRRLARQRRLRVRRFLHKTLRECTEFHCQRDAVRFVACSRPAWDRQMQDFVADPEATFDSAQVIKAGNSATVVRTRLDSRPVVIKRYNVKTPFHGLRRALRWTPRYRVSWRNGHRMDFLRLATARPLALLEVRHSVLKTVAYLVMEDAGERDLQSAIAADGATALLVEQVVAVFRGLRSAGLVHGDTKASNFLLGADGMRLVDLDAMKVGGDLRSDVRRFLANWEHAPEVRAQFADALQAAGMPL